ncbi:MAG: LytR/AlgR family response regulator transcription factor [Woeseiaceae bacterium]
MNASVMIASSPTGHSRQFAALSDGRAYFIQFTVGIFIFAVATIYCVSHGFEYDPFRFDARATFEWVVPRWGAWPILLPGCYWLFQVAHSRNKALAGIVGAGTFAIVGAAFFAHLVGGLLAAESSLFAAAYHTIPAATATFAIVTIGTFLAHSASNRSDAIRETEPRDNATCLQVWKGSSISRISIQDVDWVRAAKNYVEIFVENASYIRRSSMTEIHQILTEAAFLRVHRSYIVRRSKIVGVEGGKSRPVIAMASGAKVPVGKSYRDQVFAEISTLT